jgi:hypothetical protein
MKNTYRVNTWKYPLLFLGLSIFITAIIELLAIRGLPISNPLSDWLKIVSLIGLLPLVISLVSTSIVELLPQTVRTRLKWLLAQPGINQFYSLLVVEVIVIFITYGLKSANTLRLFASLDLAVNMVGCGTILAAGYLLLRILRNN